MAFSAETEVRAEEASTIEMLQQPEMPIGNVGGEAHADPFTGAATMSIPIEVPSGRNGIQPNLNLVYMSGNGNGWVGMGWKLEFGAVERQVRYGLNYSANDFVARMSGANSELVQAPAPAQSNEYRAKIERSFVRFRKLSAADGQAYFEATDKKGVRYVFGQTAASRMADSADPSRIFKWLLDRIEDRDGNYMVVIYSSDQGQVYLSRIEYTGNGTTTPTNVVKFYLEDRSDAPSMFTTNYVVKTAKRLKTIEVQASGNSVRAYTMTYGQTSSIPSSVLTSVTQFGSDATISGTGAITNEATATRVPPISMEWSVGPNTFGTGGGYTGLWLGAGACSNVNAPLVKTRYGDFNGDGKTDILCEDRYTGTYYVALSSGELFNDGGGWTGTWLGNGNAASGACGLPPFQYRDPAHPAAPPYNDGIRTQYADFNGDGKTDLLCEDRYTGTFYVALSDGTKFGNGAGYTGIWLGNGSYEGGACAFPNPANSVWAARLNTRYADFNGDGKTDLLCEDRNTGTYYMALSDGTKFGSGGGWTGTWLGNGNAANGACGPALNVTTRYGDFNGDGKTDLLCEDRNTGTYYVGLSDGTQFGNGGGWTGTWLGNGNIASGACIAGANITTQYGDFNGDGKVDLLCEERNSGTYYVALSDGTKFGSGGGYTQEWLGNGNAANGACMVGTNITTQYGDFNGDGKADLLCEDRNTGTYYVALSDGTRFGNGGGYTGTWLGNGDPASGACGLATGLFTRYGDFNGDGKTDFLCEDRTNGSYWVAKSGNQSTMVAGQLLSVSNGVGGRRSITYKPSTRYTNTQLPYSIQTVSSIVSCDNWNGTACAGISGTTNYDYSGGHHHFAEREFRGFNHVKVTAPAGPNGEQAITETWFHQGNDLGVDSNNPNVPNGYTKGMPYRSKVTDATGKLYSETTTAYVADNDLAAPWYTPQSQIDTYLCESGTCATHTRTTFEYDHQYGNLSLESQYGDLSTTSDDRAIYRTYSDNVTDWIVGLPTRESHYSSINTTSVNLVAHKTFFYDGTGGCASPNGTTTPTKGHLTKATNWLSVTGAEYDVWGNITCTRDANGNVSTVTYDSTKTFSTTTTNPLGHVTTTQYYGVDGQVVDKGLYGQVKSVTDPNSQVTGMEYDALGRKTKVTAPDGGITSVAYNYGTGFSVGTQHVLITTSGSGIATPLSSLNFFDGMGRSVRKETTGADGKVTVTEVQYDSRGAVRQQSLPYFKTIETVAGRWSTNSHDALGRVARLDRPDGTRSLSCFTDWITVSIDAADHRKRVTKDAFGRTIRVDEYQGTFSACTTEVGSPYATTTYQYDSRDNLTSVNDAKGNVTTLTYDEQSRKKNMRDPDMGYWIYGYDANGNLTDQTDAKGQVTWFRYDALNRRVQKDFSTQKALGAGDVRYLYDGTTYNRKGRLQQVIDAPAPWPFNMTGWAGSRRPTGSWTARPIRHRAPTMGWAGF